MARQFNQDVYDSAYEVLKHGDASEKILDLIIKKSSLPDEVKKAAKKLLEERKKLEEE